MRFERQSATSANKVLMQHMMSIPKLTSSAYMCGRSGQALQAARVTVPHVLPGAKAGERHCSFMPGAADCILEPPDMCLLTQEAVQGLYDDAQASCPGSL